MQNDDSTDSTVYVCSCVVVVQDILEYESFGEEEAANWEKNDHNNIGKNGSQQHTFCWSLVS